MNFQVQMNSILFEQQWKILLVVCGDCIFFYKFREMIYILKSSSFTIFSSHRCYPYTVVSVCLKIYMYTHIYAYAELMTSIKETITPYSNKDQKYIHWQQVGSLKQYLHGYVVSFVYISLYKLCTLFLRNQSEQYHSLRTTNISESVTFLIGRFSFIL